MTMKISQKLVATGWKVFRTTGAIGQMPLLMKSITQAGLGENQIGIIWLEVHCLHNWTDGVQKTENCLDSVFKKRTVQKFHILSGGFPTKLCAIRNSNEKWRKIILGFNVQIKNGLKHYWNRAYHLDDKHCDCYGLWTTVSKSDIHTSLAVILAVNNYSTITEVANNYNIWSEPKRVFQTEPELHFSNWTEPNLFRTESEFFLENWTKTEIKNLFHTSLHWTMSKTAAGYF